MADDSVFGVDEGATRRMMTALAQVQPMIDRHQALITVGAADGSQAASDERLGLGNLVMDITTGSWMSGADHLRAWSMILGGGLIPLHAHATLIRAAVEGAASALWVLDGGPRERLHRAARLKLEDSRQRGLAEDAIAAESDGSATPTSGGGKTALERRSDLLDAMRAIGLAEAKPPNATDLVKCYGVADGKRSRRGEILYRVLSAHAHGLPWRNLTGDRIRPSIPGDPIVVSASEGLWASATEVAVACLGRAHRELLRYHGRA